MIEKVQGIFIKFTARTITDQKLRNSVNFYFTRYEWSPFKLQFNQDSFCLFKYTGCSTSRRYGWSLCQQTIKRRGVEKEVIVVDNKDMCTQLIALSGVCVDSTVSMRYPASAKIEAGSNISHALQRLKSAYVLNSLIVLGDVCIPNSEVEYKFLQLLPGADFSFDQSLDCFHEV